MAQNKSQRRTKHCSDVFKNEAKQVLGMVAVTYQDGAKLKLTNRQPLISISNKNRVQAAQQPYWEATSSSTQLPLIMTTTYCKNHGILLFSDTGFVLWWKTRR